MFLETLDPWIRVILLAVAGLMTGALINYSIYRFCHYSQRRISPWMARDDKASPRKLLDYLPLIGWFFISRDEETHGKGFWIRPLLIEAGWMIGLPLFYQWQMSGGMSGPGAWPATSQMAWFFAFSIMIALMSVATFIDFDERMIPDEVTVTGTLIALVFAALLPCVRLPNILSPLAILMWGEAGQEPVLESLHFNSPHQLPEFHLGWQGLAIALGIFTYWVIAILPRRSTFRHGIGGYFKYLFAGLIRPRRKTKCEFRIEKRKIYPATAVMGWVWIVGMVLISLAWKMLPAVGWESLMGSLLGLGFAGTMIWLVRIVAGYALGREAMGFGDVLLMFMLGAFLGWQASLMLFGLASLLGVVFVLGYSLVTGNQEFAYGPYLCGGALVTVLFWPAIWGYAQTNFFFMGAYLLIVLFVALVAMAIMLMAISWVKGPYVDEEEDDVEEDKKK